MMPNLVTLATPVTATGVHDCSAATTVLPTDGGIKEDDKLRLPEELRELLVLSRSEGERGRPLHWK